MYTSHKDHHVASTLSFIIVNLMCMYMCVHVYTCVFCMCVHVCVYVYVCVYVFNCRLAFVWVLRI